MLFRREKEEEVEGEEANENAKRARVAAKEYQIRLSCVDNKTQHGFVAHNLKCSCCYKNEKNREMSRASLLSINVAAGDLC